MCGILAGDGICQNVLAANNRTRLVADMTLPRIAPDQGGLGLFALAFDPSRTFRQAAGAIVRACRLERSSILVGCHGIFC
jgi:hypothetical protein